MGLQNGVGNFSGAIASNIYLAKDAPRYILGRSYVFSFYVLQCVDSFCQMHLNSCL